MILFAAKSTTTYASQPTSYGPWLILIVLAALTVVWLAARFDGRPLSAVQRGTIAALRSAVLLLIAWMWWGWERVEMLPAQSEIVIVGDNSRSMELADLPGDETRAVAMSRCLLGIREPANESSPEVALFFTSGSGPLRRESWNEISQLVAPQAATSPLGQAVLQAARAERGKQVAAIVLITDGNVTDGISLRDAAAQLRDQGLPLFVAGAGREEPDFDLELTAVHCERQVFVGDRLRFDVKLVARGKATPAQVELFREGSDEPLATVAADLPAESPTTAVLSWQADEVGDFAFRVAARVADSSLTERFTANNVQSRRVMVRPCDLKVLLAWGSPHYEFRYLKSVLEREFQPQAKDGNVNDSPQLRVLLQDADLEYASADRTALRNFPVSREEIDSYDVILLGDLDPKLLGQQAAENLLHFVEKRGGGLMFIAGERYGSEAWLGTPLAPLLPFAENIALPEPRAADKTNRTPLRILPSPLGKSISFLQLADSPAANDAAWEGLPPIYWHAELPPLKPGTSALLQVVDPADSRQIAPALTAQYFGAGRVLFQATDDTHRWRFRNGDRWFGRYWRQIVRQLGRRKLLQGGARVELASDRESYRAGENIELFARFARVEDLPAENEIQAELIRNDKLTQFVLLTRDEWEPGLFRGTVQVFEAGEVRWTLPAEVANGLPQAAFRVSDPPQELARTALARRELEAAAQIAGGKYFPISEWDELWRSLPQSTMNGVESGKRTPLWNDGWLAALVVGLLTVEWWLRRRWSWT